LEEGTIAKIYNKGGTEKVIICDVREAHIRPFQATDWLDLRVGFFLSLCGPVDPTDDDTPTGLAESIAGPSLPWTDRIAIGLTDSATGQTFCGYTNLAGSRLISIGSSNLVSSDIGITTANTFYWRPKSGATGGDSHTLRIIDTGIVRATAVDGSQPHFVQDVGGAGGYCTFFGLRFTRPNSTNQSKIITMSVKKATGGGHSSDLLFTATPTNAIGEAQLESFPTTVQTLGPIELSQVPDTLYFYWPFHLSRLRIHEVCIVKVA
jgi:hypothetical protein